MSFQNFKAVADGTLWSMRGDFGIKIDEEAGALRVPPKIHRAVAAIADNRESPLTAQDLVETVLFRADALIRELDWKPSQFDRARDTLVVQIRGVGQDLPVAQEFSARPAVRPAP